MSILRHRVLRRAAGTSSHSIGRRLIAAVTALTLIAPPGALAADPTLAMPRSPTQVPAAGSTTTAYVTPNGVPVINIAAPNAAGLSHNRYDRFDVPVQGAVLNNSAVVGQSMLVGDIAQNPNLAAGMAAKVILNEVTGTQRSQLQGYLEVFGPAAQVVVANPNGITCTGCGFINTPRATLATGTPNIDANGNLTGFAVRQGDIVVDGAGLDGRTVDYVGLFARSIAISGPIDAGELHVGAGANDVDYQTGRVTAAVASGAAPRLGIDSSVLGGMYANRIFLVSTENGVGVRLLGNVAATVDDIVISALGRIQLQGTMSAKGNLTATYAGAGSGTVGIDSSGTAEHFLYARKNLVFDAGGAAIRHGDGTLYAEGSASFSGSDVGFSGTGSDTSVVRADQGLRLTASTGSITLGSGSYSAGLRMDVTAMAGDVTVDGAGATVSAGTDVDVRAGGRILLGAGSISAGLDLSLTADSIDDRASKTDGVRSAGRNLSLNSASRIRLTDGLYSADGDLTIRSPRIDLVGDGALLSGGNALLDASDQFTLGAGIISAGGNLWMKAPTLTDDGRGTGQRLATGHIRLEGRTIDLRNSTYWAGGDLRADAVSLGIDNTSGSRYFGAERNLLLSADDIAIAATAGTLTFYAGDNLFLSARDVRVDGLATPSLQAGNDLKITAAQGSDPAAAVNLTIGDANLQAGRDLILASPHFSDIGTAGRLRLAGNELRLTTDDSIAIDNGQVYDGGWEVNFTTPGDITIGGRAKTIVSGGWKGGPDSWIQLDSKRNIAIAGDGSGVQGETDVIFLNRGALTFQPGSLVMTGHDFISYGYSSFDVGGSLIAFNDVSLMPNVARFAPGGEMLTTRVTSTGSISGGGKFTLAGNGALPSTGVRLLIESGVPAQGDQQATGQIAVDAFDVNAHEIDIAGTDAGHYGLLQGGAGGGSVTTDILLVTSPYAKFIGNTSTDPTAKTTLNVKSSLFNYGFIYAYGDLDLNVSGNVTNVYGAAIASGFGRLAITTQGTYFSNDINATLYGGTALAINMPNGGTFENLANGTTPGTYGVVKSSGNVTIRPGCVESVVFSDPQRCRLDGPATPDFTITNQGHIEADGDITLVAQNFNNYVPVYRVDTPTPAINTGNPLPVGDAGNSGPFGSESHNSGVVWPNPLGLGDGAYYIGGTDGLLGYDVLRTAQATQVNVMPDYRPLVSAGNTLTIWTQTGNNTGGTLSAYSVILKAFDPLYDADARSSSFVNRAITRDVIDYTTVSRYKWQCWKDTGSGAERDGGCKTSASNRWLEPLGEEVPAHPIFTEISRTTAVDVPATVAASQYLSSDISNVVNDATTRAMPTDHAPVEASRTGSASGSPYVDPHNPEYLGKPAAPDTVPTLDVPLPTSPNSIFVLSSNPRYLIQANPLYGTFSMLGSDYLAKLFGLDPDKILLRLGDANYEANLVQEQIQQITGLAVLRSASGSYDQQRMLMDNAATEAKSLNLTFGMALTASQVAALKSDIVWMEPRVVQGKTVLVPIVYLTDATRATRNGGANILADTAVINSDSFINRGGTVSGNSLLNIVSRKDLINSSGTLEGGTIGLKSIEGDIVNRTETYREGTDERYATVMGKIGNIVASKDLYMSAGRDVRIEGANAYAAGDTQINAGNKVVVAGLVLDSGGKTSSKQDGDIGSGHTETQWTSQSAQGASVTGGGKITIVGGKGIDVVGSSVASSGGETTLYAKEGEINIRALELQSSRDEKSERNGVFRSSGSSGTGGSASGGIEVSKSESHERQTTHSGSYIGGQGVNIIAGDTDHGDVNIQGSAIESTGKGINIEAGRNVSITAAYDTYTYDAKSESHQFGGYAEANGNEATSGLRYKRESSDYHEDGKYAQTSSVKASGGDVTIIAGGKLTNEGTKITTEGTGADVRIKAAEVENLAAQNTRNVTSHYESDEVGVGIAATTNGTGQSIANKSEGNKGPIVIASPEAQLRGSGESVRSDETEHKTTAVVTQIKAGGSILADVAGKFVDVGTQYEAVLDIGIQAGSYENRAAANTSSKTSSSSYSGGQGTAGVNAAGEVTGTASGYKGSSDSTEEKSTAVTGGFKAGGSVVIQTGNKGDITLEGTKIEAGKDVVLSADGNLTFKQAANTSKKTSSSEDTSANASASGCMDATCVSGGAGASHRTASSSETRSDGVAGEVTAGGSISFKSGGDMTLQGTNLTAGKDIALDAGKNFDYQALVSTDVRTGQADGGGGQVGGGGGLSASTLTSKSGNASADFERSRDDYEATSKKGGNVTAGGSFSLKSGGDAHLEGTQISATTAALDIAGNFNMESAQSTEKQDSYSTKGNVTGGGSQGGGAMGMQGAGGAGGSGTGGGNSGGGGVKVDTEKHTKDNLTNQNASIKTTGGTTLNVGGDATLAGARIDAGGGVSGEIQGNLTIESRTDRIKQEDVSSKTFVGLNSASGDSDGPGHGAGTGDKINRRQGQALETVGNVGGSGIDLRVSTSSKDIVSIGEQSGISGGSGGLGNLKVGGNVKLVGASEEILSADIKGTVTKTTVETHSYERTSDLNAPGSLSAFTGDDPGKTVDVGGTIFKAGGGSNHHEAPASRPQASRPSGETGPAPVNNRRGSSGERAGEHDGNRTNAPVLHTASEPHAPVSQPPAIAGRLGNSGGAANGHASPTHGSPEQGAMPRKPTIGGNDRNDRPGQQDDAPIRIASADQRGLTGESANNRRPEDPSEARGQSTAPIDNGKPDNASQPRVHDTDSNRHVEPQEPRDQRKTGGNDASDDPYQRNPDLPGTIVLDHVDDRIPSGARTPDRTGNDIPQERRMSIGSDAFDDPYKMNPHLDPVAAAVPESPGTPWRSAGPKSVSADNTDVTSAPDRKTQFVIGAVRDKDAGEGNDRLQDRGGVDVGIPSSDVDKPARPKQPGLADRVGQKLSDLFEPEAKVKTGKPSPLGFEMKTLHSDYLNEQKTGRKANQWWKEPGNQAEPPVKYFTKKERAAAEVVIKDGLFYRKAGKDLVPLDTGDNPKGMIFVMDGNGRIYATGAVDQSGKVHHSSLLAGEPVAMAGHMFVANGKLVELNNNSGHYKPDTAQADAMLKYLHDNKGVDTTGVGELSVTSAGKDKVRWLRKNADGSTEPWRAPTIGGRQISGQDYGFRKVREAKGLNPDTGAPLRQDVQELYTNAKGFVMKTLAPRMVGENEVDASGKTKSPFWAEKSVTDNYNYGPVKYFNADELAQTEVIVKGGMFYDKSTGKPFDTGAENKEGAIFVVDGDGRIYATTPKLGEIHHSSFLGGKPVAMAGHLFVSDGKLIDLTNKSGHYRPGQDQFERFMDRLSANGVDLHDAGKVMMVAIGENAAWVNIADGKDVPNPLSRAHDKLRLAKGLEPASVRGARDQAPVEDQSTGPDEGYDFSRMRPDVDGTDAPPSTTESATPSSEPRAPYPQRRPVESATNDNSRVVADAPPPANDPASFYQQRRPVESVSNDNSHGAVDAPSPANDPTSFYQQRRPAESVSNDNSHGTADVPRPANDPTSFYQQRRPVEPASNDNSRVSADAPRPANDPTSFYQRRTPVEPASNDNSRVAADAPSPAKPASVNPVVSILHKAKVALAGIGSRDTADKTSPLGFPMNKMSERFTDENKVGMNAWWTRTSTSTSDHVRYFTPQERANSQVFIKNGLLYKKVGKQLVPFDTGDNPFGAIFVMDGKGRLYATWAHVDSGEVHHSSLLGGKPVAMAGHLFVSDGRLIELNNNSGHYRPKTEQGEALLTYLGRKGIDTKGVGDVLVGAAEDGAPWVRKDAEGNWQTWEANLNGTKLGGLDYGFRKLREAKGLDPDTGARLLPGRQHEYRNAEGRLVKTLDPASRDDGIVPRRLGNDELARTELVLKDGKFVDKTSGRPFDTDGEDALFVVDGGGRIFAVKPKPGELDHSSLLGDKPGAMAGRLVVSDGKLVRLDDDSKQYKPSEEQFTEWVGTLHSKLGDQANDMTAYVVDGKRVWSNAGPRRAVENSVDRDAGIDRRVAQSQEIFYADEARPPVPRDRQDEAHRVVQDPASARAASVEQFYGNDADSLPAPRQDNPSRRNSRSSLDQPEPPPLTRDEARALIARGINPETRQPFSTDFQERFVSPSGYKMKTIHPDMVGEAAFDSQGEPQSRYWRDTKEVLGRSYATPVRYFNDEERAQAEVVVRDGLFYKKQTGQPFDTGDSKEGAIFVMDGDGRIYAAKQEIGRIHHSSFLGGNPIAMGGHMFVVNGRMVAINNKSGHYRPDKDQFEGMLDMLKRENVELEGIGQYYLGGRGGVTWRRTDDDSMTGADPMAEAFERTVAAREAEARAHTVTQQLLRSVQERARETGSRMTEVGSNAPRMEEAVTP